MAGTTIPKLIKAAERRKFVMSMRRAGATYAVIRDATIGRFGLAALPKHWNSLYAYKDVKRELKKLKRMAAEDAKHIRGMELARLDALVETLWPVAVPEAPKEGEEQVVPLKAQLAAVDRILRIMDRRLRLVPELAVPIDLDVKSKGKPISIREVIVELSAPPSTGEEDKAAAHTSGGDVGKDAALEN